MKKTKFYDIYTIIHVVLVAVIYYVASRLVMKNLVEVEAQIGMIDPLIIGKIIVYALVFVYWILILILSIKLHKEELTKLVDVIVIAIISPLAPIFYLVNVRKSLKKYHSKTNQKEKPPQVRNSMSNVPGTP